MSKNASRTLQLVGYAEGTSFLVLLGIAMPLKYMADLPLAVTMIGALHGGLWILYLLAAAWAASANSWGVGRVAGAFVASILPFGPFVFDYRLRRAGSEASPNVIPHDRTLP